MTDREMDMTDMDLGAGCRTGIPRQTHIANPTLLMPTVHVGSRCCSDAPFRHATYLATESVAWEEGTARQILT